MLAQIDGRTLQVQGNDIQTAVTYSAKTTFTNTVAAALADVVVGACVQARSALPAPGTGGATPTVPPTAATGPVTATSVEISPSVNGRCTVGGGRGPGAGAPDGSGDPARPPGIPTPGRTRGPGAPANGFGGLGAFGKVTAVNGSGFTVERTLPQDATASSAAPTTQTVQTSRATTFTRTKEAKATALAVGLCVTALGQSDSTGSITATSIALRPAENGSCFQGFGGRPPGAIPTPTGGSTGA